MQLILGGINFMEFTITRCENNIDSHESTNCQLIRSRGGAARTANRLYKRLQIIGFKAEILFLQKENSDNNIIGPGGKLSKMLSLLRTILDKILLKKYPEKTKISFSPAWILFSEITKKISNSDADIVQFHLINWI